MNRHCACNLGLAMGRVVLATSCGGTNNSSNPQSAGGTIGLGGTPGATGGTSGTGGSITVTGGQSTTSKQTSSGGQTSSCLNCSCPLRWAAFVQLERQLAERIAFDSRGPVVIAVDDCGGTSASRCG
jgi:hypothetical protein